MVKVQIDHSDPLLSFIYERVHKKNKGFNIIIEGETGSGKSYSGLRLAEILDPTFDIEKDILYTIDEYLMRIAEMDAIDKKCKNDEERAEKVRGKVIIIDEAGNVADSLDFQKKLVKHLKRSLQVCRYLGIIVLFITPKAEHFLKSARELMHLKFVSKGVNFSDNRSMVKPYRILTNAKYPIRLFKYTNDSGVRTHLELYEFRKPQRKLWSPYERYARSMKSAILQDMLRKNKTVKLVQLYGGTKLLLISKNLESS